MTAQAQSFIDQLAGMPSAVRDEVLTHLVVSMETDVAPSAEEKSAIALEWQGEIDRRVAEVKAGAADLIDGEEAFDRLRSRFGS